LFQKQRRGSWKLLTTHSITYKLGINLKKWNLIDHLKREENDGGEAHPRVQGVEIGNRLDVALIVLHKNSNASFTDCVKY